MNTKRLNMFFIWLPILLFAQLSAAQTWTLIDSCISVDATQIAADPLGNIYVTNALSNLQKVSSSGVLMAQFQDSRFGRIGSIDASDPMEILLFYPDLQVVLLLDRSLTPINRINVTTLGLSFVRSICRSNDKSFWLFDGIAQQLKKINPQATTLYASDPMPLLIGTPINPTQIIQNGNYVAIIDTTKGIYTFDIFGNLIAAFNCQSSGLLGMNKNYIYALSAVSDTLFYVDIEGNSSTLISAPFSLSTSFNTFSADILYIAKQGEICRFSRND